MTKRLNKTLALLVAMTVLQGCAESVANEGTLSKETETKETTQINAPNSKTAPLQLADTHAFAPIGLDEAVNLTANGDLFVSERAVAQAKRIESIQPLNSTVAKRVDADEETDEVSESEKNADTRIANETNPASEDQVENTKIASDKTEEKAVAQAATTQPETVKAVASVKPAPEVKKETAPAKKTVAETVKKPAVTPAPAPAPKPVEQPKKEEDSASQFETSDFVGTTHDEEMVNFPYEPISKAQLETLQKQIRGITHGAVVQQTPKVQKEYSNADIEIYAWVGMNDYYDNYGNLEWAYKIFNDFFADGEDYYKATFHKDEGGDRFHILVTLK